ncbi:rho guanine nucleotide exchange factor 11 isoform X2 [Brienomyrus brachyistius]|uniref:rho guanine nucleotide exchange factor 11 isoform X2 n=1 Tax=Brienomyrus brachyistius TaxID=42636 RepID=UPI0020B1C7C9|nr:rho guanine nucleotide exchange factor 11 isoform X2 [Brienomyrus brachyistius]
MSIRLPASTLDRFTSLIMGDSERRASGNQQNESSDLNAESTGQGLVQRCVVVQRDELGFGFTVCGERIKLVQNVRPGGAAVKAGVQEGDRIIKVNGSLVSAMTHQEVVKLIKSGTYVAMTLQGPPPSAPAVPLQHLQTDLSSNHRIAVGGDTLPTPPPLPPASTSNIFQRITGPKPFQDPQVQKHASQILRKMLEQEEAEIQNLTEELSRNPSPSLQERIRSAERRAHQVRVKVQQELDGTRSESLAKYFRAGDGSLSVDSNEGDFEACESPNYSPLFSFRTPPSWRCSDDMSSIETGVHTQIIGPEDYDDAGFLNETNGPFQDIEVLKTRPAHMIVFMRYVFSQLLDPNPLLFYLWVEAYLGASAKDARTLAPRICSYFLDPDAPLKIPVPEEVLSDIESRLQAQEDIRGPLSEVQQQVLPVIQDQIQRYRNQQTMGLSSLFGEGDLQQLDGDPVKDKQVVDRQVSALLEILLKFEEDRSSSLVSAVLLYLRYAGIKTRPYPGLPAEKDKWLVFFPKTKKLSGTKKEKDGEDKKRNPILKYIGKSRSTSQSMKSGNVRHIIQQFESSQPDVAVGEADPQRLSSSSLGDEILDRDSPTVSVRLARSESLKAQGEGRRRGAGATGESVPRSRSDVDMDDCGEECEAARLLLVQHSNSSSASSSSARSLENATPPYTPRSRRRSMESPVVLLPDAPSLDEDVTDSSNWQETVDPETLAELGPREVDRQAVIYELFTTESSHLRTLRVLDQVFFQRMRTVLSSEELACIFPNLPRVYELHASLCESMKKLRESPIVPGIGDIMLARFEGAARAEFQEQVSQLCSQQSQALELIKNKQRKDPRFAHIVQECEANPHCRRLQLKDLLVSEMQRLTKYPLLLDNILKHTESVSPDFPLLQRAQVCCRGILQAVNEVVRETEHRQRLSQYQRRLDVTPLERQANPVASQFKNLDLSTKRMIHEGALIWRVSREKAIEVQALLLSDLLVLLQRGPDDRLVLRCPSRSLGGVVGGSNELKTSFCPVVRLDSLLVRSVATDNKALYVISTSERQIYELVAGTLLEKNLWKNLLEKAITSTTGSTNPVNNGSPPLSSSSLRMDSSGSHVYQTEDSLTEESVGMDRDMPNDVGGVLELPPQTNQSETFLASEGHGCQQKGLGVAEAALRDLEKLRRLVFKGLEEDAWSQDSGATPTNEATNERSPQIDGVESEPTSSFKWETEELGTPPLEAEDHSVQVVRKAEGVGSASFPDDIIDVSILSSQSAEPSGACEEGNTFYLVLPQDTGETQTDELINTYNTEMAQLEAEQMTSSSVQQKKLQDALSPCPTDHGHSEDQSQEAALHQSQAGVRSHVRKNMNEVFHTIDELMTKLLQLREIEATHSQILRTLTNQPANKVSVDLSQTPPTAALDISLDRVSVDGVELSQTTVQSTGF